MKLNSTKTAWFMGFIGVFIIITTGVIVKQIGIMKASSIMGIIVVIAAPFIGWLLKVTKNPREHSQHADKSDSYFNETRQKFYWRIKSYRSISQ